MPASSVFDPESLAGLTGLLNLIADKKRYDDALHELTAHVGEARTALKTAQEAQAKADHDKREAEAALHKAEDRLTRAKALDDQTAHRQKQLDDHSALLARRQADLETSEKHGHETIDIRDKALQLRERAVSKKDDEVKAREAAIAAREAVADAKAAEAKAAEERMREIMGVAKSFTLQAETGKPFTRMGGG